MTQRPVPPHPPSPSSTGGHCPTRASPDVDGDTVTYSHAHGRGEGEGPVRQRDSTARIPRITPGSRVAPGTMSLRNSGCPARRRSPPVSTR